MYRALLLFLGLVALSIPSGVQAAASFKDLTNQIVIVVDRGIIPLIYALTFIVFLIGMVRFFFMGGEEERQKGKQFMLWGIIGFVVLASVWGIVRLLLSLLPGT